MAASLGMNSISRCFQTFQVHNVFRRYLTLPGHLKSTETLIVGISSKSIFDANNKLIPAMCTTSSKRLFSQQEGVQVGQKEAVTADEDNNKGESKDADDGLNKNGRDIEIIDFETSIRYMESSAYKQTYGSSPVWTNYRRNHSHPIPPSRTRKMCIRGGKIVTSSPCPLCRDDYLVLHETNLNLIKQFICPYTGNILLPKKTGICQKNYKLLRVTIFKAIDYGYLTVPVPFRKYDYSRYFKNYQDLKEIH